MFQRVKSLERMAVLLVALLLSVLLAAAEASAGEAVDRLVLMTEEYPPFNFVEEGEVRGITTDVVVRILDALGSGLARDDIQVLPWARAYNDAQGKKVALLFSTIRSLEREDLFKWAGPVGVSRQVLMARRDRDITIDSMADVKDLTVGAVVDDYGEIILKRRGVDGDNVESVVDPEFNARKMAAGRIDLLAYGESAARWNLKRIGQDPSEYETVYVFEESPLYLAFSPSTPDEVVDRFQAALEELKKRPAQGGRSPYERIVARYLE